MKKITLLLIALLSSWQISAQVGILQNFDSGTTLPTGWTETGVKTIAAAESCSGNSVRDNVYSSSATGTLVSPNQVAASNATDLTVSFDYKIEDWGSTNPRAAGWGSIEVQYSTNNGGAWTTFFTINDGNHVVANTCATFSSVIPAASLPNGSDVKIRFLYTWVAGDYDIYIDNFSATQTTVLPPLCTTILSPVNGATNVLSSIISWNSANGIPTGYKLNVGTSPGGTNVLNMFDVGNVTTYNLGTLISGATHYVTVIPYNGNGDATGCTESSFTACGAISALPHTEPFATFLPNCWQEGDNGDLTVGPAIFGSGSWVVDGLGNLATTGAIRVTLDAAADNDWVLSPEFFIPAAGYELKFNAAATQGGLTTAPTTAWESDDYVEVLASTTGFNNWSTIFTYNDVNVPSNSGTINSIDLSAYSGQTVRFAFRAVEGASNGTASVDFSIDDLSVRLTPTCPDQTGLTVNNVTSSSANTSWDDLNLTGAIGYEYAITTSATPPASGTGTLNTFYAASGLLPQTVYYLHVRSECAASTFGNWATTTFTTGCAPLVALPWIENFDALTPGTNVFPTCWAYSNTTNTWSISTTPTAYSGANSLRRTWSTDGWAFTPTATLTAGTSYRFSYYVRTNDAVVGYDITVGVGTSQTSAAMTNTLSTIAGYQGPAWVRVNHEFTPTVTGEYSFGVHVVAPGAPNGINFDDFKIELSPTCPDQTGLTIGIVTSTTADTSWDDLNLTGAVGYEYAITTSATPPASGTSTTATIYAATGLSPQTVYYLHVRSECSGSTYGAWATTTFTTACVAITALPHIEGFDAVANPNCWTTALVTGTTNWAPDTTNDGVPSPRTGTRFAGKSWVGDDDALLISPLYNLAAYPTDQTQINVWIYRSANGLSTDRITFYANTTNNLSGATQLLDIPLPITAAPAVASAGWYNYIIDVPLSFNTAGDFYIIAEGRTTSSFSSYGIGFDDYALELKPACPTPNASFLNVTSSSADLSWPAVSSATLGYEYVLDNVATDPAGSGISTLALTYPATGLNPLTLYYFHIRSVCSAGTYSTWSTISFTTLATPPVNDDCLAPIALTVNSDYLCGSFASGTTVGATNSGVEPTLTVSGTPDNDVWYSFVATQTAHRITLTSVVAVTGTSTDMGIGVFNGPCASLTLVGSSDPNTYNLTGLTPGNTYLVNVYGWYATGTNEANATFNICIGTDPVLSNVSFDKANFVAYPNPVKDVLNLSYKTAISNVKVINLLGQEVLNTKANSNEVQVNMSALNAGAYIVNITVDDAVHTIKVIKE